MIQYWDSVILSKDSVILSKDSIIQFFTISEVTET